MPLLEIGYISAEKIAPSPVAVVADMKEAINIEKRLNASRGSRLALKDSLNKVVADFNRMITIKKHRIDTGKKALVYNLLLTCRFVWRLLSSYPFPNWHL